MQRPSNEPKTPINQQTDNEIDLDELVNTLGALGNCQNVDISNMDTLIRSIIIPKPAVIEKLKEDSEEDYETFGEEEALDLPWEEMVCEDKDTDKDQSTKKTVKNLDKILQRIEVLQAEILIQKKKEMQTETETETGMEEEMAPEPKLDPISCELGLSAEQSEILCLKRSQHRLQCEIDQLICCYRNMRSILHEIGKKLSAVECQILKMRRLDKSHKQWMAETANDLVDCQTLHQTLATVKLKKQMSHLVGKNNMACGIRYSHRYLRKSMLCRHLDDFNFEISDLKMFALDMVAEIDRRLANIRKKAEMSPILNECKCATRCPKRDCTSKDVKGYWWSRLVSPGRIAYYWKLP